MVDAASFVAGHAAGRHAGNESLYEDLNYDLELSVHEAHDFFDIFLPKLATFIIVLLVTGVFAALILLVINYLLKLCGIPERYRRHSTSLILIILVILIVLLVFGSVGVEFGDLFLGLGLMAVAFSSLFSAPLSNFSAGVMLTANGILEDSLTITFNSITGTIVSSGIFTTEIRPSMTPTELDTLMLKGDDTYLIPNSQLYNAVPRVRWAHFRGVPDDRDSPVLYPSQTSRQPMYSDIGNIPPTSTKIPISSSLKNQAIASMDSQLRRRGKS